MKQYKSARNVEMWLNREADYADVTEGRRPYLPVEMGDKRYAFKLVKGRRNFVLVDEEDYCNTVGLPCPMSVPKGGNGASGSAPPAPSTETEKPPNEEEINSDSLCFSDRDLLG